MTHLLITRRALDFSEQSMASSRHLVGRCHAGL